jgi:hypothetical protein
MIIKTTGSIKDSVKVLGLAYLSRTEKLIFMISKIDNAKILIGAEVICEPMFTSLRDICELWKM